MPGVAKEAKLANGRSHRCEKCPYGNWRCTPEISRVCSDNFIEGFIKGARFIKKRMKEEKR